MFKRSSRAFHWLTDHATVNCAGAAGAIGRAEIFSEASGSAIPGGSLTLPPFTSGLSSYVFQVANSSGEGLYLPQGFYWLVFATLNSTDFTWLYFNQTAAPNTSMPIALYKGQVQTSNSSQWWLSDYAFRMAVSGCDLTGIPSPTPTAYPTASPSSSMTPSPSPTGSATSTPSTSPTMTPSPSASAAPSLSPTTSPSATPSTSASPSSSMTSSPTSTSSATVTPSNAPTTSPSPMAVPTVVPLVTNVTASFDAVVVAVSVSAPLPAGIPCPPSKN
jgi:hypothetical protein